ncbi:hypothetical protein [Leptospira ilyithenensis]|uniref:Uncharacterized protein n=1 Tax=Leptospira ilyithenensis TaxID=2484901 RepID=A0A4R9LXU6_9LEPT|nr:hypothetical protein [Leptospira ilyithenensis]TGN14581.1 hypothetical protein EHS11_00905 [Leptospira ilyithenensis]
MPVRDGKPYGSFRKMLVPRGELPKEAIRLKEKLETLRTNFANDTLAHSEILIRFVLMYMEERKGRLSFLKTGRPLPDRSDLNSFLMEVRFYGMPDTVRQTLLNWNLGNWDLRLIDRLPSSFEMLTSQAEGYRFVTIDWDKALQGEMIEDIRDVWEHVLHDLAHAFMFFREEYEHEGQVLFFKEVLSDYPIYEERTKRDEVFRSKFEYCISDMNSHPAHLRLYLRAILR